MASDTDRRSGSLSFLRGVIALFAFGMVGVIALAVQTVPTLRSIPELDGVSSPMLLLIAAANSTILLAVFVLLGAATATRVGLYSHIYAWATQRDPKWTRLRDSVGIALIVGTLLFIVISILDVLLAPFVRIRAGEMLTDTDSLRVLAESVPTRLLYGGITEELLLRWGLMAPIAWGLWRVRSYVGNATDSPPSRTMWAAIGLSAVVFGIGHLPAVAASFELTPGLIARTVLLNAIAGVGFGWLFWRRSIEAAMIAHATFHVVLVGVSTVLILAT